MFLGIEIGGTKLQVGVGPGDGSIVQLERTKVDAGAGAERIRQQIVQIVPNALAAAGVKRSDIRGVGIGFGGPVDADLGIVTKSHQVQGWAGFALADWARHELGWPAVVQNDADTAGLAEACFGAGRGASPIFYITIGSGIGGGLIIDHKIYRGAGAGAAEIGHLVLPRSLQDLMDDLRYDTGPVRSCTVESLSSGWGIEQRMRRCVQAPLVKEKSGSDSSPSSARGPTWGDDCARILEAAGGEVEGITVELIAREAKRRNRLAQDHLQDSIFVLAWAIAQMVALVCPKRIVIGGGVALLGDQLFTPLRHEVGRQVFEPFAKCLDIVAAALGEAVVVQGALKLARDHCGA
jgi:glucokinase